MLNQVTCKKKESNMAKLGLEDKIVDKNVLTQTVELFKKRGIKLPSFEELSDPSKISEEVNNHAQRTWH
jgi:hypothetical protein